MRIFFSAGEPSGDLHGANLIQELRKRDSEIEAVGFGGPRMAAAGCQLHEDMSRLAVMWFLRVFMNLHRFLALVPKDGKALTMVFSDKAFKKGFEIAKKKKDDKSA